MKFKAGDKVKIVRFREENKTFRNDRGKDEILDLVEVPDCPWLGLYNADGVYCGLYTNDSNGFNDDDLEKV